MASQVQDGAVTHVITGLTQVMVARGGPDVSLRPVTDPSTLERVLACGSAQCLRELGQSAGIDLVVQVRVRPAPNAGKVTRRSKASYLVSMVALQPLSRGEGRTEQTECRACGSSEIKHSASLLASIVAESITLEPPPAPPAGPDAPSVAQSPPPLPAPLPLPAPPPLPAPQPDLARTPVGQKPAASVPPYLSVAAMAGGALLVGTGLYSIHIDGEGSCDLSGGSELCARRYKTRTPGIAMVAEAAPWRRAGSWGSCSFHQAAAAHEWP